MPLKRYARVTISKSSHVFISLLNAFKLGTSRNSHHTCQRFTFMTWLLALPCFKLRLNLGMFVYFVNLGIQFDMLISSAAIRLRTLTVVLSNLNMGLPKCLHF